MKLDRLDRQLLHALAIDGRASFRGLAAVLDSSEQTLARRYRRLVDAGILRVVALAEPEPTGYSALLRIQVEPAAARPLAAALAKRPDVQWVSLIACGGEVVCGVRARSRADGEALLLDRLPRTAQVRRITAYTLLHDFAERGRAEWSGFDDRLTPEQAARVADGRPLREQASRANLTADDEPLLPLLAQNGRITYAELADRTGRPEAQVARRVDALLAGGAISLDVDLAAELLGFSTSALLYLSVAPARLHVLGEQLALHPETSFVAAVTGPTNLVAGVRHWTRPPVPLHHRDAGGDRGRRGGGNPGGARARQTGRQPAAQTLLVRPAPDEVGRRRA